MHTPNDVLMGAQPGQMNLRAIRRADELRKTIDQLLQALQFDPASLQWSDVLDKFAVLNVQLQYLSAQLRPLLHHYVVHPKSVNQTNAPILPIMLASKLLPEQDAERDALMSGSRLSPEECAQQTATLNAIIDGLTLGGGVLDTKGPTRVRMAAAVKAAMAEGAAPQAQQQDPGEHGPMVHGPRGQQAAPLGGRDLLAAASYGAGLT